MASRISDVVMIACSQHVHLICTSPTTATSCVQAALAEFDCFAKNRWSVANSRKNSGAGTRRPCESRICSETNGILTELAAMISRSFTEESLPLCSMHPGTWDFYRHMSSTASMLECDVLCLLLW